MKAEITTHEATASGASDSKVIYHNNKYDVKDVVTQFKETLTFLGEKSGLAVAEPVAAPVEGAAAGGDAAEGGDAAMMEGGEDMAAGEDMAMAKVDEGAGAMAAMGSPNPNIYDSDARDYAGFAQLPAALLRCAIVNPAFGDALKANAVNWEFRPQLAPKENALASTAGLVSAAAATAEGADGTFWLSGYLSKDDIEALKGIAG